MASVKVRKVRNGFEVALRVCPEKPGHSPRATVRGKVRDGALVSNNGVRWTFR